MGLRDLQTVPPSRMRRVFRQHYSHLRMLSPQLSPSPGLGHRGVLPSERQEGLPSAHHGQIAGAEHKLTEGDYTSSANRQLKRRKM